MGVYSQSDGEDKRKLKGTEKQRQDAAGISSLWKVFGKIPLFFGRRLRGRDGFRRDQATVDRLVRV